MTYQLNLIDTPGHVDFRYEVSRSLAACEGALLVVDAARASRPRPWPTSTWRSRATSTIIPVLNKIDLPGADPERARARSPS